MPSLPRRFFGVLEPIATVAFFAKEVAEALAGLGLDAWQAYFCSRAAPLGRVSPETVAALFYNFNPDAARLAIRWDLADPADVIAAHHRAAGAAMARLLADGQFDVARAVELLREAATACRPEGRPLYAAHAALEWPADPPAALWFGANLLREYRGDGHVAVLVSHGVGPVEALTLHSSYLEADPSFLHSTRGWEERPVAEALERLVERGFMRPDGRITDGGAKFREMLEIDTDRLTSEPWEHLGPERCEEALTLLTPVAERILERKGTPRFTGRVLRGAPA